MAKIDDLIEEARKGSADAMLSLGCAYADGQIVPHDYSQAVTWFERAAGLGIPSAFLELAVAYEYGLGYEKNYEKSFMKYMKAAHVLKCPIPLTIRGHVPTKNMCSDGYKGVLALAEAGFAHSMYYLGVKYNTSTREAQRDFILAAKWMGQAAELDYPPAVVSYSGMRINSHGQLMSGKEVTQWMLKAYEYDKSNAKSIAYFFRPNNRFNEYLAKIFSGESLGVQPDKQTEDKWEKLWNEQHLDKIFWKAVSGNSWSAQELASKYSSGSDGAPKDKDEALKWFQRSRSNRVLSSMYLSGSGVPRDEIKGFDYFLKACQGYGYEYCEEDPRSFDWAVALIAQGHLDDYSDDELFKWLQRHTISVNTKYDFRFVFENLNDVSPEKISWWKKRILDITKLQYEALKISAEAGNAKAQYWYAHTFKRYKGRAGISLKWILKSAEQGYVLAQFVAGLYYGSGLGAPIDTKLCLKWLTLASKQGLHKAQLDLIRILSGNCLAEGGYPQRHDPADVIDFVEAYAWYLVASEGQFDVDTLRFHESHVKDLSSEDLARAFKRADELKKQIIIYSR